VGSGNGITRLAYSSRQYGQADATDLLGGERKRSISNSRLVICPGLCLARSIEQGWAGFGLGPLMESAGGAISAIDQ